MDNLDRGRMLLSHNFDITDGRLAGLSREEFTEVFRIGTSDDTRIQCRSIAHPHWIVEILFDRALDPQAVGAECARILAQYRQQDARNRADILILGGIKTTPPTSPDPDALQPGQWGVDVVETVNGDLFLTKIDWDATIAQKPADSTFKVQLPSDL
ncbi:DUF2656 domain-containing protein [Chamaesiphon minutus]|uniref:DUF2656 domain-containing protein n=1 Tax=Chamaesiphon minutus (strain ATCC 27169 / PCC 6605) TaxID=1173020 RepID=K9UK27_CHAP6|nr:DUF2656 domain-containing protein [Chamaesiphon minutus]AFY95018.1 Protein of unknown function (DUF2656) [Chamaesiphon minutus PCC 6605]